MAIIGSSFLICVSLIGSGVPGYKLLIFFFLFLLERENIEKIVSHRQSETDNVVDQRVDRANESLQ